MIHLSFTGYHNCHIYMQVHGSGVDYVFDRAVFQLVPNNAQWKTDAQARIEHLRKAPITVRCVYFIETWRCYDVSFSGDTT